MGIQSRKNKTDAKKNNITVNINTEENPRPVKVVKQPKPLVVKQPKPVVVKPDKVPDKVPDVVKPDTRVEELKKNANIFQNLRDRALNQGVTLPNNFSAIPDIRNSNDLTMVNKTLLDRIKILEQKLRNKPKPTTPVLTPDSSTENDYVTLAKSIVSDMRVLASSSEPNELKIKAIIQSIAKTKNYINLDDNQDNDEKWGNT